MTRLSIGQFENRATGQRVTVYKRQNYAGSAPLAGRRTSEPASVEYEDEDGQYLNPESADESVFQYVISEELIHRVP